MQYSLHHDDSEDVYQSTFGSTFRCVFDLAEPTSAYFGMDTELD